MKEQLNENQAYSFFRSLINLKGKNCYLLRYVKHKLFVLKTINGFQGEYRWLSNFWPCTIVYQGNVFSTLEHAYQSAKVEELLLKEKIKNCATPSEAKDFFQKNNIVVADNWTEQKKLSVMKELLWLKFGGREPFLTQALLLTEDAEIIEDNTWEDRFWGVCNGIGDNHLGKLIMQIREEMFLQKEKILFYVSLNDSNKSIAATLNISERELYEKLIAFKIKNAEWWIS